MLLGVDGDKATHIYNGKDATTGRKEPVKRGQRVFLLHAAKESLEHYRIIVY